MNKFQPFHYIKKYAALIVAFFILMTIGLYALLNRMQTYTASAIIDFVYEGADQGLVPKAENGEELDVTEIYSSGIISQALENLEVDPGEYPIDQVRSSIVVTRLDDPKVAAVNEANSRQEDMSGSDLLQSTRYRITYKVKDRNGKEQAKEVLDEVLDEYFSWFSETYVNSSITANSISDVNLIGYDYIEQIGLIEDAMENTIENLEVRAEWHPEYYSIVSGLSFNELLDSYRLLKETGVSSLEAYILSHRVTGDEQLLISKYRQLVRSGQSDQTQYKERISEVEDNLDAYVRKLRESDNTARTVTGDNGLSLRGGNVIDDVEWPSYNEDENAVYDQRTEYEKLLQTWIEYSDNYNRSVAETEYNQYVIDCFSGNAQGIAQYQEKMVRIGDFRTKREKAAVAEAADGTESMVTPADVLGPRDVSLYLQDTVVCTPDDIRYVEEELGQIVQKLNEMYRQLKMTDNEFNEYIGAEYINMVASAQVKEGLNIPLYMGIGAILFLVIGCIGVVLLGRLGDIVEYVAYVDHQLRLPNRSACDRYIRQIQEKVLPVDFGCVLLHVMNQGEINRRFGREKGDQVLAGFTWGLKNFFGGDNGFIGYNGGGQFVVFTQGKNEEMLEELLEDFRILLRERFAEQEMKVSYTVGMAESSKENTFHIRNLISKASSRKKEYDTGKGTAGDERRMVAATSEAGMRES